MNTNNITNITDDLNNRCSPSYTEDEVTLRFESEELFADWFKNVASRHANWIKHSKQNYPGNTKYIGQDLIEPFTLESIFYVCDRYGKPRRRQQEEGASKRQKTKESIKIGCTAKLLKYTLPQKIVHFKPPFTYFVLNLLRIISNQHST
ncbi:hypothetical protein G6F43_012318 [Rhizopus delemar]|nr:hypothetical protein G6F43_012318 [Rhizopus delemar]